MTITDEMVERGARAICIAAGDDPDQGTYAREMVCTGRDGEPKQRWEYWSTFARAVLTAAIGDGVVVPRAEMDGILESWADALNYKGEYLREKHGDDEDLKATRARYARPAAPAATPQEQQS